MSGACSRPASQSPGRPTEPTTPRPRRGTEQRTTALAAPGKIDALSQFQLHPMLGELGQMGFSQSTLMMVVAAALMLYEFTYNMCVETIGHEGRRFFPFVFTLF